MFYRYAYHIIAGVVMATVIHMLLAAIPSSAGSKINTEPSKSYSLRLRNDCMAEMNLRVGYIGEDVIALCDDGEHEYAIYIQYIDGKYLYRMSSTHGVISTGKYPASMGIRQMVLEAMSIHMDVVSVTSDAEGLEIPVSKLN